MEKYLKDIEILKENVYKLPIFWDGKNSVLELKEADYNWRQMEWWAFYFEYKMQQLLKGKFNFPGDAFNNTCFDMKGGINWDMKAKAIKSDETKVILNDVCAMQESVEYNGFHGEIIALCDVKYNDTDRSFQKWHTELKGGKSNYELERESRTSVSRYRKTEATLTEVVLIVFKKDDFKALSIMKQGRNSNGKPRPEKFMLDLETIDCFENYILKI
jgi:hypothetical protein